MVNSEVLTWLELSGEKEGFELESGERIKDLKIQYHTFGTLNPQCDNVVWCFHAMSSNSNVLQWWPGLFGENDLFTPNEYFIICVNALGSPYGSTAPENLDFPLFTVRDIVKTQLQLAQYLKVSRIKLLIGGSFGGSQALEFAYSFKGEIAKMVLIACSARETAWGIAIHEAQRLAMKADLSFGKPKGGSLGIQAARAIGMLTYRTSQAFIDQQTDKPEKVEDFKAASYIRYQGEKFDRRFDALCYYYLTQCMDTHNIGRGRQGIEKALSQINIPTQVIGIDTDVLLPPNLQRYLAKHLANAEYVEIRSAYGHDGFLIETPQLTKQISQFLNR